MPLALSITVRASESDSYRPRNSPPSLKRLCSRSKSSVRLTSLPITEGGMALVSRSPVAKG